MRNETVSNLAQLVEKKHSSYQLEVKYHRKSSCRQKNWKEVIDNHMIGYN